MSVSGREQYKKNRSLIEAFGWFYSCLPRFVKDSLWSMTIGSSGRFSLLLRYLHLRGCVKRLGGNVYIGPFVVLKGVESLVVGNNVSIHASCYIDAQGGIEIGNDVSIAHQSSILSFNHHWDDETVPIKYNPVVRKPVYISDDVWVGCGVRIMPGVTIGRRCVVAAGSVVTQDIPSGTLVGGVPAKVIKVISKNV